MSRSGLRPSQILDVEDKSDDDESSNSVGAVLIQGIWCAR